jgi:peptidoglycan/xylan/chitin deacetylase (PgdA/CDA1 family)
MKPRFAIDLARKIGRKVRMQATPRISSHRGRGVISFTFDDFPKSALTAGGSILERYGARGTYYTSANLARSKGALGALFDFDDVRLAHARGHEIACHTYTHINCADAEASILAAEVHKNMDVLSSLTDGLAPRNFAYPFGAVSSQAVATLSPHFQSCRGIQPGTNGRHVDLTQLCANKIYSAQFCQAEIQRLIAQNAARGGWLIFYTHDVREAPSPFGCSEAQFESVVACAARSAPILSVRDVMAGLCSGTPHWHVA